MNDSQPRALDPQQLLDLAGRELRDRDDEIGFGRGVARLVGETAPEIRSRVLAGEHEQIMKRRDLATEPDGRQPLIQSMEEVRAAWNNGLLEQKSAAVAWESFTPGAQEAMRPVAKLKGGLRIRAGETEEDLTGVDAYTREVISQTVSGVERNHVSKLSAFSDQLSAVGLLADPDSYSPEPCLLLPFLERVV